MTATLSQAVILLLFVIVFYVCVCVCVCVCLCMEGGCIGSLFNNVALRDLFSFAIIVLRKRKLHVAALLDLYSCQHVTSVFF